MPARSPRSSALVLSLLVVSLLQAQGTPPQAPLTLVSREGRRTVPTTVLSGQELIALDDLASIFQVSLREDTLAGGITLTYRGRTIVASADQPMASVNGRVVTLPSPVVRSGRRWLVPIDFIPRALAPIYDQPIDLRRGSRLLIVGDVRVPRVTARIDTPGPPTRATIDITPAAAVSSSTENGRVLVRVFADGIDLALPTNGAGFIEQIRAADAANTVAVILAPAAGLPRITSTTTENVTHVVIELPGTAPAPPPPPAATESAAAPRPDAPPVDAGALTAPRPVLQTIVIDPGHGGDDVGAKGAGGAQEKQLTLDVARRLRMMVEARLGLRVILTRDDDRAVGLDERASIANNGKADLLLSLHANASLAPASAGAEVYHLRLDREGEEARREAAADAVSLPILGGGSRPIDIIRWDLAQARHVETSAALADMLAKDLGARVAMSPRPVQQAPLRVLEGADMPAALIEMAYLTNPAQEKLAASEDYRNAVAQSLLDTIIKFRSYLEEHRTR